MADPKLDDLFELFQPRGLSKASNAAKTTADIDQIAKKIIVDSQTTFLGVKGIREQIIDYCTGVNNDKKAIVDDFFIHFHAICNSKIPEEAIIKKDNISDEGYWKRGTSEGPSFNAIFPNCINKQCNITVIATSEPFITRADCNTEDIELFLNYVPNHIANTLLPYLEIEMRMNKTVLRSTDKDLESGLFHLSTPSTLRFLLGSVAADKTSSSDRALFRIVNPDNPDLANNFKKELLKGAESEKQFRVRAEARSGMDLFFAPQTLTNMDSLKSSAHTSRLIDAKPFTPFASIVGFELTIANAGAGDMVTKHGKLELEIHDKSRISEMSEFFRGPAGYGDAQIWSTFGWLCPRDAWNEKDDDYAKFINEKMHTEICWQVKNTQFSFDQSGRVKLSLELVSFGSSDMKKGSIKLGMGQYEQVLYHFERAVESLQQESQRFISSPLGKEARIVQLINAGAAGRMLPSGETNVDEIINKVVSAYAKRNLSPEESEKLVLNLQFVLNPTGQGRVALDFARAESITKYIERAVQGPDPFLPTINLEGSNPDEIDKYFSEDLIKELNFFNDPTRKHPDVLAKEKGAKAKSAQAPQDNDKDTKKEVDRQAINIDRIKVVSFGKLFCNSVLPALIETLKLQDENVEVQVIFYTLNDECGPVSGHSIAEFPIDLTRFVYALDDAMRARLKNDITINEFFTAIINNQFNDDRSIGYGMLSKWLHAPFDRNKTQIADAEQNSDYESRLAEWQADNPSFARPMIEMSIEQTTSTSGSPSRIHKLFDRGSGADRIVKIHIYDKQHNPRKLFSQVAVDAQGNLRLGAWDIQPVRNKVRALAKQAQNAIKGKGKKQTEQQKQSSLAAIKNKIEALSAEISNNTTTPDTQLKFKDASGEDIGAPILVDRSLFGRNGIRAALSLSAPTITIGVEGSMVKSANIASKTDDLIAAANLVNLMKAQKGNNANSISAPPTGLEGPGGLPIRTVPASLSITTFGCPNARCYQQYFIDLGTGTSLDNLYTCTQITHKIAPGKFESSLTFAFSDGYGKFGAPPSAQILLKQEKKALDNVLADITANQPKKDNKAAAAKPTPPAQSGFGTGTVPKEEPPQPLVTTFG